MELQTRQKKVSGKPKKLSLEKEIEGIQSSDEKIRARSFSDLYPLSGSNPGFLYPYWDVFEDMLRSPEITSRYYAIHILSNLASADKGYKFRHIFNLWFYDLLNHESPVIAPHIAEKSGKIVKAIPALENKVTPLLLNASRTSACRHPELLKAYVLAAFETYFPLIPNKEEVIQYIKDQVTSTSPTTRNKAKDLIRKFNLS